MIGQSISHYTITEKLGEGGKGVVYKAEDTRLNRTVALKFLLGGDFDDEKQRAGFIREAQTTAALDHPSICTVYEIGEDSDRIFISMAFIDGPDLRAKVQSGPLPIEEVLDISIRVAQGLEAAHAKNVFHCDISNTNIMTTADGQVKIMDFGLARIIDGVDGGPDKVSGTIQYMSPEQIRGENLDQRTDIWSLGICMFEMLTGRQPFNGDYSPAIFYSILNQDPPSLADLRPDVPVELERIVEKAMAKDAAGRFQIATELISRLETTRKRVVEGVAAEPTTEAGAKPAVAVLPFVNMSADKEQEYFCHGIAEDIINFLTQVEGLRVVARTSAFAFEGKSEDIRKIGSKLGVTAVLEGSVRKSGNKLRITAQLINVTDGYHLWSERYDRELEDVFAIQDEIAKSIVRMLKVKLIDKPEKGIVAHHSRNMDAYTFYLKGRFHWNRRNEEDLKKGMEYFRKAIAEDPGYALAYAGLADSFNLLGFYCNMPSDDVFPKARAAAERALEMDDTLAEAHCSLAFAKMFYEWDWKGAEKAFKRSIELNPRYPTAHQWYSEYLVLTGQAEQSVKQAKVALESDPLSLIINTLLGWVPYFNREYDESERQYKKTLEMDVNFVPTHFFLGLTYVQKSMYDEAVAEFHKASALFGSNTLYTSARAYALAMSGERSEAKRILDELIKTSAVEHVSPYYAAAVHAALGDTDQVFEWLDTACRQRDMWMGFLKVDPIWDGVRSDPRFADKLRCVGLEA